MSTGYTDGRLDHLLDSASSPQPPQDFEQRVMHRLHRLRKADEARAEDAALDRLLQQATRPVLSGDLTQRVIEQLHLGGATKPRSLARRPEDAARRYHLLNWARAASLLLATTLACLLCGRPEHTAALRQAAVAPSLSQSPESAMAHGRDSLLTEAFDSIEDTEVIAALCAVSTDSSEGQTTLRRRNSALSTAR